MIARAAQGLHVAMQSLPDLQDWRVRDLRLPWKRRFEIDFELERV